MKFKGLDKQRAFIEASDYLKRVLHISYKEQSEVLGVDRSRWDHIRTGRLMVRDEEIEAMLEQYPDTTMFFTEPEETDKEHIMNMVERYVVAKEERERILLDRIKHLEQEVKRLKGETK